MNFLDITLICSFCQIRVEMRSISSVLSTVSQRRMYGMDLVVSLGEMGSGSKVVIPRKALNARYSVGVWPGRNELAGLGE